MVNEFNKNQHSSRICPVWEKIKSFVLGLYNAMRNFILLLIPVSVALLISALLLCFFARNRIAWDMPAMIFVVFMVCWLSFSLHPSKEDIKSIVRACLGAPPKESLDNTEDSSRPLQNPLEGETIITEQHKSPNN